MPFNTPKSVYFLSITIFSTAVLLRLISKQFTKSPMEIKLTDIIIFRLAQYLSILHVSLLSCG